MAQAKKISELTTAGTLSGLELVVVVQDGETRQGTSEQITASVSQRFDTFQASVSADINTLYSLASTNTAAITSLGAIDTAFEIRVNAVSAAVEANTIAVASLAADVSIFAADISSLADVSAAVVSINSVVSALAISTSAAITSVNNTVSALEVRVSAVSAAVSANAAAITSVNSVVSALDIRVGDVSAVTSVNAAAITSINAEVSLKVYRSGDYMTNARYIEFDTSASNGLTTGKLAWNSNDGTLDVGLPGDSVLQVGQETLFYVKNGNASTISNGRLVMATSVVGNSGKIIVDLADGSGFVSPEYFLGIATQDIATGEFGYVTHFGLVRGINATGSPYNETWSEADLLYANVSILGGLTKNPPAYPGFSTPIAIVVNATSNTGSIFVRMKSGEYLQQLHDVDTSTKASGDILAWNSAIGAWTNTQALVSLQADVSTLQVQIAAVDVSAVNARLDTVSAVTSVNAAAITSVNAAVSLKVNRSGDTMTGPLIVNGSFGRGAPVTKTGSFTLADTENWIICNGTGSITVTFPAASSWTGREVMIKTIAAQTVVSASSDVVPLAGGAAGTAILSATAGAWATLVSDGTNWIIMQA